jgi:hypothetical protein
MSSQIDNVGIDSTFPEAGKDNDSQGFRDNFASIKNNFAYAKDEIEDLQNKVILKSALEGENLNNDLGGSNISNGNHTNFHGTSYSQTVSGTANIDVSKGSMQSFTLTTNSTFTFTNWPDTGIHATVRAHFKNNGSIINVGNDVVTGKRYTINEVNNTNFISMGAQPTTIFVGSISGNTLTVSSKSSGTITKDTFLIGAGITAGTKIIATSADNPSLTGTGGTGTYTIDIVQSSPSTTINGITTGIIFTATNKGSGTGKVQPWREVILSTEGTGTIVPGSDFDLPLLLNPNGSEQVIEAWCATGSTTTRVFVSYVSNLDSTNTNYTNLNVGTLSVDELTESTTTTSGALQVRGGAGIVKNLNVGGDVVVDGNLLVSGNTTLTTSSITIADIGNITNVEIQDPRNGDLLKYDSNLDSWSNNVDLVTYAVTVDSNVGPGLGGQGVFYIDDVPLSTDTGNQISNLKNFAIGKKYRFLQTDSSNIGYDLRFSTTPDTTVNPDNNPGLRTILPYTENVTIEGEAGGAGAYTEILITEDTPSPLYLYADMGNPALEVDSGIGNLSNLAITGTAGQFTISPSATLTTNKPIRISGTWSGSTAPFGYNSAGTIYYIAVGGTGTAFQLLQTPGGTPVNTSVGTPNGTLITVSPLKNVSGYTNTNKIGAEYPITVANGPVKIVTDYTVPGSQTIIADTTAGDITITLPLAPSVGTIINIFDAGYAGTNGIEIDPGSASVQINGSTGNVFINGDYGSVTLVSDGANWTIARLSFSGSEDVVASGSVDLSTSVSYFSTSGVESCTLLDGKEGQVKTLIMKNASGAMTVSVANAGWKTSGGGTITFTNTGDACILQYIQGKWYVVANDKCTVETSTPVQIVTTPITASSPGTPGQMAYDANYIYVCVATNTWRRATTATW